MAAPIRYLNVVKTLDIADAAPEMMDPMPNIFVCFSLLTVIKMPIIRSAQPAEKVATFKMMYSKVTDVDTI